MENDIRVGIIGSGYIADFHAKAVQAIEGMELSAVVSPNRDKAERFASRYNIESIFTDFDTFFLDQPVDMVVLATPNCFHHDHTVKAINKGIHVLVEKPMAVHVSEALSGGKPVGEALKEINDQWTEILKNNGYIK
jgi:predicted dehydrogenase